MTVPPRKSNPPTGAKAKKTDEQVREEGYTPFLRPEHTGDGEAFRLTGWNTEHKDGEQFICEVENEKGVAFSLGVRKGSPDHRALHKALGSRWQDWAGGIIVAIRKGTKPGTAFVNVASADPADPFK